MPTEKPQYGGRLLGDINFETGIWYPDARLVMPYEAQRQHNIRSGHICQHDYQPERCPWCEFDRGRWLHRDDMRLVLISVFVLGALLAWILTL